MSAAQVLINIKILRITLEDPMPGGMWLTVYFFKNWPKRIKHLFENIRNSGPKHFKLRRRVI